jgi:carboxypeptidase family protein
MFSTLCSISTRSRHASACVALALLFTTPALAQETRATVTGIVKDAQGAVVPGVTVTVLNTDTNVSTDDVTNQSGVFTIQKLQPGPIRITAALPGFKTFVREGITLRTAETVTVNVQLTSAPWKRL